MSRDDVIIEATIRKICLFISYFSFYYELYRYRVLKSLRHYIALHA